MSYILDALRRADAERARGAVPGLHAQPLPPTARAATSRRPWVLALGAAGAAALAAAWLLLGPGSAPSPHASAPANLPPAAPTAAPTGQQAMPMPAPQARVPAAPPAGSPGGPRSGAAAPVPAAVVTAPAAAPVPAPARPPAGTGTGGAAPVAAAPRPAASAGHASSGSGSAAPAQAATPLPAPPADLRPPLPALTVSGVTYSDNPAYRMLILNGQVYREGERPAPDLVLEQIGPKQAVLRLREHRYTLVYP